MKRSVENLVTYEIWSSRNPDSTSYKLLNTVNKRYYTKFIYHAHNPKIMQLSVVTSSGYIGNNWHGGTRYWVFRKY